MSAGRWFALAAVAAPMACGGALEPGSTLSPDGECDLAKPFQQVRELEELKRYSPGYARLTRDELTIYFSASGGPGKASAIYVAERVSRSEPFADAKRVNGLGNVWGPPAGISADGLHLYLGETMPGAGSERAYRLRRATRTSGSAEFRLESDTLELPYGPNAAVSADESSVLYPDLGPGLERGLTGRVRAPNGEWGAPSRVAAGLLGALSEDGKTLVHPYGKGSAPDSVAPGAVGLSTRSSSVEAFAAPTFVDAWRSEQPSWLSPNGCRLYAYHAVYYSAGPPPVVVAAIWYSERPK
ncbi:MAG: hypothetical protein IPG50_34465 [Myxococcales bacterium]|nr:hypothetical protein [Myxococcales bacterium]